MHHITNCCDSINCCDISLIRESNGLNFWIDNETKYPLLAQLAEDLLSILASEAYVETVFRLQ